MFNLIGIQGFLIFSSLTIFHFFSYKINIPILYSLLLIGLVNFAICFKSKKLEVFMSMAGNILSLLIIISLYFFFMRNIVVTVFVGCVCIIGYIAFALFSFSSYPDKKNIMMFIFLILQPVITVFSFWLYFGLI